MRDRLKYAKILSAVVAGLLLVGLLLMFLGRASDKELSRYGDIGQSFDVIATILSALALIGVAASLSYQARQARNSQVEAWIGAHGELLKMVIAEPEEFVPCIADLGKFSSTKQAKQFYFSTLWLSFHRYGMEMGYVTEEDVRAEVCGAMFESQTARDLWVPRKEFMETHNGGIGKYYQMVDEEYERAVLLLERTQDQPEGRPVPS